MRIGLAAQTLALVSMLAVGCGGAAYRSSGGPEAARQASAPSYADSSTSAASGGSSPAAMPNMPSPASEARSSNDARPSSRSESAPPAVAPKERQGLGTEWGETRDSRVYEVSFTRNDPERPSSVVSVYYNDRDGVDALVRYHERNGTYRRGASFGTSDVSVDIRNEADGSFDAFRAGDRNYVIGSAGARYTIMLSNRTGRRYEAVATVDGLDVINGKPGNFRNRGYILSPYASVRIDGFRRSDAEVAAFRFGAVGDSYAAQKGSDRNVGVIGVALFAERGPDPDEMRLRDTASPFPQADPRYAQPPRR